MDDDIRDRFRGVSRTSPTPNSYGRQARPLRPVAPTVPRPKPMQKSATLPSSTNLPNKPQTTIQAKSANKVKRPKQRKTRTKLSKKWIILAVVLLLLPAVSAGAFVMYKKRAQNKADASKLFQSTNSSTQTPTPKAKGTIRLVAVGGSLAFDSINTSAKKADGGYDYLPMMASFKPFFDKADIRVCSQATPGGGDKNGLSISGYPTFNAPTTWSNGFADLGCNLINLASDHINDKGQPAIDNTLTTWDEQKSILAVSGANRSSEEQSKIRYFTVKDVKFAYLAYTTSNANKTVSTFGVNIYSDELATKQIAEARKNNALVIVSMNWGTENSADINAEQDKIAQHLASQNADLIIGGGSHVIQPAKILNGTEGHQTLVWFSLGNFLTSELPVDNLIGGMAVVDFDIATGNMQDPKLLPLYMHYEWTPQQKSAGSLNDRHNFKLFPLDMADDALAKSLNNTTVEAQTARVTNIITKFAPIKVIKSTDF